MIEKEKVMHNAVVRILGKSRGLHLDDPKLQVKLGDILRIVKVYGDPWISKESCIVAQTDRSGINNAYFFGPEDLELVERIE